MENRVKFPAPAHLASQITCKIYWKGYCYLANSKTHYEGINNGLFKNQKCITKTC